MDFALADIIISELYETERVSSAAQSYRARDVSRKLPGVMVLWLKWCLLEVLRLGSFLALAAVGIVVVPSGATVA